MGLFSIDDAAMAEIVRRVVAGQGIVPIPELVRRVHQGDSSQWHEAVTKADGLVQGHNDTGDRGARMLQTLESSWTGDGADAAAGKIRGGVKAAQLSSEVYGSNARHYTDNAYAFESLKTQLTPMAEQAPERSTWDTLTPWDTDQEDQINRYRAQLEQNRQTYQAYEQAVKSSQAGVQHDYGDLSSLNGDFGDIKIEQGASKNSTDNTTFDEPRAGQPTGGVPGSSTSHLGAGGSQSAPTTTSGWQPGGSTSPSGYPAPNVTAPAASAPSHSPVTGFGPGSGGNNHPSVPGLGQGGTALGLGPTSGGSTTTGGRFSAPGTGAGGSGSGNAGGRLGGGGSGGAPGNLGAGKGSGAGTFGPGGQSPGSAAGGGAGARGGMGAMGGAGAGRGKGSEDEEHKRQYVQDSDEPFKLNETGEVLRDPDTGNVVTPPTIGG